MIIDWFAAHTWAVGLGTFFLMWGDWILTVLQQREQRLHYSEHYQSYPIDTVEGNPLLQSEVKDEKIVSPRHLIPAVIIGILVGALLIFLPEELRVPFIGYVWGLFLIVMMTHLSNLAGYRASRRGMHGKLYLHLRTAYLVQMGRYLALAAFLIVLAVLSESPFIAGVAVAGLTSFLRQLLWLRRVPPIDEADSPPDAADEG